MTVVSQSVVTCTRRVRYHMLSGAASRHFPIFTDYPPFAEPA